jgi:ABC-type branched-subunit amino acid transport system substrate-binding protein
LDIFRQFVDLEPGEQMEKNRIYQAKVDFDAVFIPDKPETAAQISLQLKYHGIREMMLLGTNIWNPKDLVRAGGEGLHPAVFPVDFNPDSPEKKVQEFVAGYEEAFGETPDYFAAIGFDTAMQVMDCLSDPGVTSRDSLKQALKEKTFERVVMLQIFEGQ